MRPTTLTAALTKLLDTFSPSELRRLLRGIPEGGEALVKELPVGISETDFASEVAVKLLQRRMVDEQLLEALRTERPRLRAEVDDFQRRLEIASAAPSIPPTSPYLSTDQVKQIARFLKRAYPRRSSRRALIQLAGLSDKHHDSPDFVSLLSLLSAQQAGQLLQTALDESEDDSERAENLQLQENLQGGIAAEQLEGDMDEQLQTAHDEAVADLQAHRLSAAHDRFAALVSRLEKLSGTRGQHVLRWLHRCRLNLVSSLLSLQKLTEARQQLVCVDPVQLSERGVLNWARYWIVLGDPDRGEAQLPNEQTAAVLVVRQLAALERGVFPDVLADDPEVQLRAAQARWQQGELREVVSLAAPLIDAFPGNRAALGGIFSLLVNALQRSVLSVVDVSQQVRPADRGDVLAAIYSIEQRWEALDSEQVPQVRQHWRLNHVVLYNLEHRDRALQELKQEIDGIEPLVSSDGMSEGLVRVQTPWSGVIQEALRFRDADQLPEALRTLRSACTRWPDSEPLHYRCATLLYEDGQHTDALWYATRAMQLLPGWGQRLVVARCHAAQQRHQDTWDVLAPLGETRDTSILQLRALAAAEVAPAKVAGLWEALLEELEEPAQIVSALLALATTHYELGELDKAQERAWQAFEHGQERMSVEQLGRCHALQRASGRLDAEIRQRLRSIYEQLESRFPTDLDAQVLRLTIHLALGEPGDVAPPDLKQLLQHGILRPMSIADAVAMFREHHKSNAERWEAWHEGALTFEQLCAGSGQSAAIWISRLLSVSGDDAPTFAAPVPAPRAVLPSLKGKTVLLGELELLLLAGLGLLDEFDRALGPHGGLVMFADVAERLLQEPAWLEAQVQHTALHTLRDLERSLRERHDVRWEQAPTQVQDTALAKSEGWTLLHHEPVDDGGWFSAAAALRWLHESGWRDQAPPAVEHASTERSLALGLPEKIMITSVALQELHRVGALEELLDAARAEGAQIRIGPYTTGLLRRRRQELESVAQAAELMRTVHTFLGQLKIDSRLQPPISSRCLPPELPLPRHPEVDMEEVQRALLPSLSWREALLEDDDLLLLSGDLGVYGSITGVSHLSFLAVLNWSAEGLKAFRERIQSVAARVCSLGQLVHHLTADDQQRWRLASRGYIDAIDARDVRRLAERYRNPLGAKPLRHLQRLCWPLLQGNPLLSLQTRLHLSSRLFTPLIWEAWCGVAPASPEQQRHLLTWSLAAISKLDDMTSSRYRLLEDVLVNLIARMLSEGRKFFVSADNGMAQASSESAAGQLMQGIIDWLGRAGDSAQLELAVHYALLAVWKLSVRDGMQIGPKTEGAVAQLIGQLPESQSRLVHTTVMILSSVLGLQAASHVGVSVSDGTQDHRLTWKELYRRAGQQVLVAPDELTPQQDDAIIPIEFSPGQQCIYRFSQEALVFGLLAEGNTRGIIEAIADRFSTRDGQLYQTLLSLSASPQDRSLRDRAAWEAMTAPWRLIRTDPTRIAAWGTGMLPNNQYTRPRNLQELRALLSEPGPLLPEQPIIEQITARLQQSTRWDLLEPLAGIPGHLQGIGQGLSEKPDEQAAQLREALHLLQNPAHVPAAWLGVAIMQLYEGASLAPILPSGAEEIDIRERLPVLIAGALQHERERMVPLEEAGVASSEGPSRVPPEEVLFSSAEEGILRICASITASFEQIPLRDGIWLTWRLYVWFMDQWVHTKERSKSLCALMALEPGQASIEHCSADLLDPQRFGPSRYPYRLAIILSTLLRAQLQLRMGSPSEGPERSPHPERYLYRGELTRELIKLAERDLSDDEVAFRAESEPTVLGWSGPIAIPDMALLLLLEEGVGNFRLLREEVRQRWYEDLIHERTPSTLTDLLWLASAVEGNISASQRRLLAEHLTRSSAAMSVSQLVALMSFHGAGLVAAAERIEQALQLQLAAPAGLELMSLWWQTIASQQDFVDSVLAMLAEVQHQRIDPVPYAMGLSATLLHGDEAKRAAAAALLELLSQQPPYNNDPRMGAVLELLPGREA